MVVNYSTSHQNKKQPNMYNTTEIVVLLYYILVLVILGLVVLLRLVWILQSFSKCCNDDERLDEVAMSSIAENGGLLSNSGQIHPNIIEELIQTNTVHMSRHICIESE